MKHTSGYIKRPGKYLSLILAVMLQSFVIIAQDRDRFDSFAAKYKDQHAVYTNISEQLVITAQNGELAANSNVILEKLFVSDLSLNRYTVDFFEYGDFNVVTNYSGYTYLPGRGKTYKKTKINAFGSSRPDDYVFYDDRRVAQAYYSGLTTNSVTETRYSIWHTDVHMLPSFEFQDIYQGLPVANATFEVVAPNYVKMKFVLKGENTSWITQTKEEKNGKIYYRFTASDVPAFKKFDNVPSWRYHVPHVIPYIVSYRITGAKKDSVLANGTDDLYRYLYNSVRSLNMKQDTFLTQLVEKLTKNDKTARDKAAHIYKWVQDNIHYVAIENGLEGFVPRPADTVLKRKYGDCKDMSSIIIAMCRKAGLNAYFAWIGTNSLPYKHEETPLSMMSNHMICALKLGDEWVFLDGTHALLPFGHNRDDIQGKETMVAIGENNYKILTIPVEPAAKNVTTDSTYVSISGTKITGSLHQVYNGYEAWDIGYKLRFNKKEEEQKKMIKALTTRGSNKYLQTKYDIQANQQGNKEVGLDADFTIDGYAQNVGKEWFVNMNLLRHYDGNYIDTKDRIVPWYFHHKERRREVVVLEIPKGYRIKYIPPSGKGALDDLWSYSVTYKVDKQKKTITLTKEYELNTLSIGTDKFVANNTMVDNLKNIYKESVVLTTN